MAAELDCDVVVIGAGRRARDAASAPGPRRPGASCCSSAIGFPRFHIGEVAAGVGNDVFDAIGVGRSASAPPGFRRNGARASLTPTGSSRALRRLRHRRRGAGAADVAGPRETMDTRLLEHAATSGADVRQGHRVLDVAFDDRRRDGVVRAAGDRTAASPHDRHPAPASVVDASGRARPAVARLLAPGRRAVAGQRRDLLALRRRAAQRGPPRRRHPRRRPARSRLVLADPESATS
jgi:hypothetical protein